MSVYLMEHENEGLRMEQRDPEEAAEHIRRAGIRPGDCVLDCGCASGWLTRMMGSYCAPGSSTGLDISDERIARAQQLTRDAGLHNVRFVQGDIHQLPFADHSFDVSFSRYTFEYLKDPLHAIGELRRVTRPGGRVVVADLDGNGVFHYPIPAHVEEGLARMTRALGRVGFDPFIGRKLFHYFKQLPFQRVDVQVMPHHLIAGKAQAAEMENWEIKLNTIRPYAIKAFSSAAEYDTFARECIELLQRQDVLSYSVTFIVIGVV